MLDEPNLLERHVVVLSGKDTMLKGNFYEIQCSNGSIIAVDKSLWNSWTGIRYMNGEEYHGTVFVMGTQKPYGGTRICTCNTCQKDCDFKRQLN
jgi:hypothetical protein